MSVCISKKYCGNGTSERRRRKRTAREEKLGTDEVEGNLALKAFRILSHKQCLSIHIVFNQLQIISWLSDFDDAIVYF